MSFLLDLFTGTSKWLYIAIVALSVAFIGVSALSISLYVDKSALSVEIDLKDKFIIEQGKQLTKAISDNKELLIRVSAKSAEISFQNEVAKQNSIDKEKNMQIVKAEKTEIEARYKNLRESLNKWVGDKNATSCQNAVNFVNSLSR